MSYLAYAVYAVPMLAIWAWHMRRRASIHAQSSQTKADATTAGLLEPASLHPIIDASRCIGCGSCVKACPEQPQHQVLGLINGKADLVSPTDCIGHGACRTACPVDAITLVFGTERRGVEIPILTPKFETTVPGIFVAGELGGMGLIRNALEQGRQAVDIISDRRSRSDGVLDLVIVGGGPAGLSASLAAMAKRMRFVTLEQESLGGCVFQYPRGKLVMTAPAMLPIIGKVSFGQISKEDLLEFWRGVEQKTGLKINYKERVDTIEKAGDATFVVGTSKCQYRARNILLAIGRRGTPRKLGVPGEDLPKVVYRLIDAEQYAGQNVLVVGGGDSALEAATSIAEIHGTRVALSYRGAMFERAKQRNRERLTSAVKSGVLSVYMNSSVQKIGRESVLLDQQGRSLEVENNTVIVNAGGVLPNDFLRRIGIAVDTKYGTA